MYRRFIVPVFLMVVLGLAQGQAGGAHFAAYWAEDYPTHWSDLAITIEMRDYFASAGYEILDADRLKTWMDARIRDRAASVVAFCKDVAPDTVLESNSANCTLRRYLDAGGKIVWHGDVPFFNQGNRGGGETNWAWSGQANILGIGSVAWWDSGSTVTITAKGIEWGLTRRWASCRPQYAGEVSIVLATDSAGNAAGWVKHFVPGDTYRGFVRLFDWDDSPGSKPSLSDMRRVAEYGMGGNPFAHSPSPADGAVHADAWVTLSWLPGDSAASHDVYFGDSLANVEAGTGGTFRANRLLTYFDVGLPGRPYPNGLVPGTTYYWRIDEVEANGWTKHKGNVWSFTTASRTASDPYPPDGTRFVDRNVILSWKAGFGAVRHEVYFGDNLGDVNEGLGGTLQGNQESTSFDVGLLYPNGLTPGTTYYWRVDGVKADRTTVHKGGVWNFTTTFPGLGTILQEKWNNIYGDDLNALKSHWKYPDSPDETKVITQFDTGTNLGENYGGRVHGWLYAPLTGNYTFWVCTDDQGELWLSTDGQPQNVQLIAYVKDSPTASTGWAPHNTWTKYASQKSNLVRLTAGDKYYIMTLWKEGLVDDHCQVAWEGPGIPERMIIPGDYLSIEPIGTYPIPADGARIGDRTPLLRWNPREAGVRYDVYFGTDFNRVNGANRADKSGIYRGRTTEASYATEALVVGRTYYWRIDDVEADGWTIHKGTVWSFTVVDTLTIECQVSSSEDDGYASNNNLQNLDGAYLRVGASSFAEPPYYVCGMVFRNVEIPQRAEIIGAYLKIRSYNSRLTDVVHGKIEAEAADSVGPFGSSHQMGSVPRTSASVNWDHYEPWTDDTWYNSPNIASVIQEVINRSGWSPRSSSLAILYSTREREGGNRNTSSCNRGGDYAPKLEITYAP